MLGQRLLHYEITEKLGEGGAGIVYKARDTRLDRFVALKILSPGRVADAERRRRFVQEAKSASALNHPNIVTIYDIGDTDGACFIAMEYVPGQTLGRLIGRKGLPLEAAVSYAVQIAGAMARAHEAGIVHRDLKPANIMVTRDGTVKILDFGLAKLVEPAAGDDAPTLTAGGLTEEGKIVGTLPYMSPEQAQGKPVDARSDIFSFGSLLFEMATGRRAFAGETAVATLAAILHREPPSLSAIADPVPPELERAVMRCLRKEPQRRWQTMADLKIALEDLREESGSGKLSAAATSAPARAGSKWILAAAALAVAAAALTWELLRKPAGPPVFETERLTYESGLTGMPSISPDGKLLVYSSDRDGPLNLYVQQIGGRQPVRLTNQEAADWMADFSPDGSKVVFRSSRDGGGIYVTDALGGPAQKIADRGWFPRYSPDGSTIAYIVLPATMRTGKFYLVPASGGAPRPFQPAFSAIPGSGLSPPVWSPDGQSILFDGLREGDAMSRDWWIAPVSGGEPARVTAPALNPHAYLRCTFVWRGRHVYYLEGTTQGGMSVYRVPLAGPPWKLAGAPERITSPLCAQTGGSISADGRLVFTSWTVGLNVWSLPLKAGQDAASDGRRQLTNDSTVKWSLTGAANGSKLAYATAASMERAIEIRVRDTRSGREDVITTSGRHIELLPRLSADGSRLAWSDQVDGKIVSLVSETGSGSSTRLCESCTVVDFFPDLRETLVLHGKELLRLNAATGARTPLVDLTGLAFSDASLSPEGRWLAFTVTRADGLAALYLMPAAHPIPRDSWVQITEDRNYVSRAAWSPDGKLIYYASTRDNFWCLWAQRITARGKPDGPPLAALHLHRFLESNFLGGVYFAVGPEDLYILLSELKGNAWMVKVDR